MISRNTRGHDPLRYAVVGLGHIAQESVLPAFANAPRHAQLTALVSDDPVKLKELGQRYHVHEQFSYDDYDACLASDSVDAVYIALPNHLHCEFAVRAAQAGKHVLCEKPMAVTEEECRRMIVAAEAHQVELMIAYRLHFEKANLTAIELARSGELGDPRLFQSSFTMQVREGDIRLQKALGGGTLYDIGIYCINAARHLFADEPIEAFATAATSDDPRFQEVDETVSAILRFPGERLATFTTSFGAANVSEYRLIGTEADLRLEPGFSHRGPLVHHLTRDDKTKKRTFRARDQFAPELIHLADCVRRGKSAEPSGREGLIDVRIIAALERSIREGRPIALAPLDPPRRPGLHQEIERPERRTPRLVHTESPKRD